MDAHRVSVRASEYTFVSLKTEYICGLVSEVAREAGDRLDRRQAGQIARKVVIGFSYRHREFMEIPE